MRATKIIVDLKSVALISLVINTKKALRKNMTQQIPFYFDYISHNAYLAWTQLLRLAHEHNDGNI
jgi:hypothetical protein